MIYYKITDKDSKAWGRHELFSVQHKQTHRQLDDLIEVFNLPQKAYTRGASVVGFEPPEEKTNMPEGMRINKGGLLVPARRTKRGKEIDRELTQIKFPSNEQYMQNIFGVSAYAKVGTTQSPAFRISRGCAMKKVGDTVLISVKPQVLAEAKKSEAFNIPSGLEEIIGSEYQNIIQQQNHQ